MERKEPKVQGEDAAAIEQVTEQVAQETRPLFVLLGQHGEDELDVARRHLLFLAERIQWLAYYEPWADAIWRRGLRTGEIRRLSVWPSPTMAGESGSTGSVDAWIPTAYLCQPQPLALAADLPVIVQQAAQLSPTALVESSDPSGLAEAPAPEGVQISSLHRLPGAAGLSLADTATESAASAEGEQGEVA